MASDAGLRAAAWRDRRPGLRLAPWRVSWPQVGPLAAVLLALSAAVSFFDVADVQRGLMAGEGPPQTFCLPVAGQLALLGMADSCQPGPERCSRKRRHASAAR